MFSVDTPTFDVIIFSLNMFSFLLSQFSTGKVLYILIWGDYIQVIREGSDITLVGWGAQLAVMEQACADAQKVIEKFSIIVFTNDNIYSFIP